MLCSLDSQRSNLITPLAPKINFHTANLSAPRASFLKALKILLSMDNYEYKPLSPGQFIRYMVLEPGKGDDPLICSLHESHVDSAIFEAISYVWGTICRNHAIICDGKQLEITANLRDALQQVRQPDKQRSLWADSICVNQDDLKERSQQVSIMGQIYSKAEKVLLCIGPDHADDAEQASRLTHDANAMILATFKVVGYSPGSFPYPKHGEMLETDSRWTSFAAMLEAPWFRRGWVVQESGLAKNAVILWGDSQIPWDSVMRTWRLAFRLEIFQNFPSNPLLPTFHEIWRGLNIIHGDVFTATHRQETVAWYPESSLGLTTTYLEIMRDSHDLLLSDERDRVYAFLALAQKVTSSTFQASAPNYELSVFDTYLDFARKYLLDTNDLTLLNYVHHDVCSITEDVVSWCPRWDLNLFDVYISTPSSATIRSSINPSVSVLVLPGDVLQTHGVILDSIAATSPVLTRRSTIDDIGLLWSNCRAEWGPSIYSDRSDLFAFSCCLTMGQNRGEKDFWTRNYSHYMYQLFIKSHDPDMPEGLQLLVNNTSGNPNSVSAFVAENIHNRKCIITKRGYYSLAPGIAQEGDVVAIIFGTRSPVVLRHYDTRHGRTYYKIVGEAFVGSEYITWFGLHENRFARIPMNLGQLDARDWEDSGQEEQDIFLV